MDFKVKDFFFAVVAPLFMGGVVSQLTQNNVAIYETINKPLFAPVAGVFPAVWSVLYLLMGLASYLIWAADAPADEKKRALVLYTVQLVMNGLWSIFFFNLQWYGGAFVWLVLLWLMILATISAFAPISKTAGWLMVPYLLWVTFAGALNLAIALLN